MPFKTFNSWLFDGRKDSPIPKPKTNDKGKVITPDILKYNSPITHTFLTSMFLRNGPLNYYLNKYFNDINLRYLQRDELMKFIKRCVMDFRINKREIVFYPRKARHMLYEKLREKIPLLKNDDISLLCDIIEKSNNKKAIFDSLGLNIPKKKNMKKPKKIKSKKISLKDFLNEHFSVIS